MTRIEVQGAAAGTEVVRADLTHLDDLTPLFDAYRQFTEQPADREGCRLFLRARLSGGQSVIFLAYVYGAPAGFTQLYATYSSVSLREDLILNDLFVSPAYRCRGVGRELLNHAQAYCRTVGAKGLALETGVENHVAQALYRSMGWSRDEVYRHMYWRSADDRAGASRPMDVAEPESAGKEGSIAVRPARRDDIPTVLRFLHRKAAFDGCPERMAATEADLEAHLFGARPLEHVLLAEADGSVIGLATYFFTYASFAARPALWLDDLFVSDDRRGQGTGTALLRYLARIAEARGCARMEWTVSTGNERGIAFYERCGAQVKERTRLCRLEGAALREMAGA